MPAHELTRIRSRGSPVLRALSLGAVAAVLVLVAPAHAAAPNYILVSGPGLKRAILLADWDENLRLLASLVEAPTVPTRLTRHRPRLDLAEFWGWSGRPRPTRPSEANQHGSLYPAHGSRAAVVELMVAGRRVPRLAPRLVLRIFARHGVPTRL
jgi:hypothetical protein